MALRSKPVTITPVRNRNGSVSYRVLGTVRPKAKQRKQNFCNLDDAVAVQAAWECERMQHAAGLRPKITRLTQAELAQAEAAVEILRGTGSTLIDAARQMLRAGPVTPQTPRPIGKTHAAFLADRRPFIGPRRYESLKVTGEQFIRYIGEEMSIASITTELVSGWLSSKGELMKKSWNNYRADLFTFFAWCAAKPRAWLEDNPVGPVPKHRIVRHQPERLEVHTARELMRFLEENHPDWVVCFALALFLGIRPDRTTGEIAKLAECVARDGLNRYLCNGVLHITAEIAKDRRSRQTAVPANAAEWFSLYELTPGAICPEHKPTYQAIREKFRIPHDGLRHTAISAHVSLHGSFADAASQFGNSEAMIRTHYFNRMSKAEAAEFYSIAPNVTDALTRRREGAGSNGPAPIFGSR